MTRQNSSPDEVRLRLRLARLLEVGTWISCALLATGLLLDALSAADGKHASSLLSIGIAALIALPSLRVAVLLCWFSFRREYDFAAIAAVVLAIIAISTFIVSGGS